MLRGLPPTEACSDRYPAELRDRWGVVLSEFQMRGIIEHRLVHADPNMANFAFLDDGRVVVYDFGCVKEVPRSWSAPMPIAFMAVIEERVVRSAGDLRRDRAEQTRRQTHEIPAELIGPYIEIIGEVFRSDPPYTVR